MPVSALRGEGLADLEREIIAGLPEGPPLYDADYFTDQSQRTLAAELVREKVLLHTRDELPYTTAVVIDQFEEPAGADGRHRAGPVPDDPDDHPWDPDQRGRQQDVTRLGTSAPVEATT